MEFAGIVAGKVLKQSKTGVRTYLMVKTEKWQFSGGQSETLPAKGYVLCAVESGMGKTGAGQTERNVSGRQGTSSQDGLPSIGSRVRISGSFSLYTEATNIGQFDARNYYAARKIYGQVKKAAIVYTEPPNIIGRGKECLWQLRRHLAETFLEVYGEENGALLAAMLLGERTFLSEETQSLYKAAGALHVIAVSGVKTLKLDIPLVPETSIKWALMPLHIAKIYILKLCLDEEIIPRCRFPCSRGYLTKCINQQKKQ